MSPTPDPSGPRELRRSELHAAAGLLARAFARDPGYDYALAQTPHRVESLAWMYRGVVRSAWLRHGQVDALGARPIAVALWLKVEEDYAEPIVHLLRAGLALAPLKFGVGAARRLANYSRVMRTLHNRLAPRPHLYLQALAVEPEDQGKGAGSTLLAHGLARADAAGLAVYLETDVPANLTLYERHGFALLEKDESIATLPIWSLVRPARR